MKVTAIEAWILTAPDDSRPHWVSHFIVPKANELLLRLRTDEGLEGFGIATSYTPIEQVVRAIEDGILDELIGTDALAPEPIFSTLFSLTYQRRAFERGWTREAIVRISAAVDIAVWDLVGKAAGLPLYRLFGGYRNAVPAYVTCAYYRDGKDEAELREEMRMLKAQGHTGFKAKVGGLSLDEDLARLAVIREVIGDDAALMIDVNRGWDLDTAIEGAKRLVPFAPTWLEEPVRWVDDRRELKHLAATTSIPLSAGESELTSYACRSLVDEQAIRILQFDCTMMGGFTEGRKLAALCELNHVKVAPHHDCFIHAHIVAGSPAGLIVESFTDPERDPLQAELFENPPRIDNGTLYLNEAPGLGLTLSPAALEKYGSRIL
jgi:L-alanine-DL-glutamate epimerase-like enolase superfamily enzyme